VSDGGDSGGVELELDQRDFVSGDDGFLLVVVVFAEDSSSSSDVVDEFGSGEMLLVLSLEVVPSSEELSRESRKSGFGVGGGSDLVSFLFMLMERRFNFLTRVPDVSLSKVVGVVFSRNGMEGLA